MNNNQGKLQHKLLSSSKHYTDYNSRGTSPVAKVKVGIAKARFTKYAIFPDISRTSKEWFITLERNRKMPFIALMK